MEDRLLDLERKVKVGDIGEGVLMLERARAGLCPHCGLGEPHVREDPDDPGSFLCFACAGESKLALKWSWREDGGLSRTVKPLRKCKPLLPSERRVQHEWREEILTDE